MLIGERSSRPQEIRAFRTAAEIRCMTARAIRFVERFAADKHILRRELSRELGESSASPATTLTSRLSAAALPLTSITGSGRGGWRLCGWLLALCRCGGGRPLRKQTSHARGGRQSDG